MLVGLAAILLTHQISARLEHGEQDEALVVNGHRYSIPSPNGLRMPFGGGWFEQKYHELTWAVGNGTPRTIVFWPQVAAWLDDDAFWGGHEAANQVRYLWGLGTYAEMTDCLPIKGSRALAVLEIHLTSDSSERVFARVLVRIEPKSFKISPVVSVPAAEIARDSQRHLLFAAADRSYLVAGNSIQEIDAKGAKATRVCDWDKSESPSGLAGQRWMIGETTNAGGYELRVTDIHLKKTWTIFKSGPETKSVLAAPPSPEGPYLLIDPAGEGFTGSIAMHLPDGRKQKLPGQISYIAGPYAVAMDESKFTLYLAASGKKVGSFPQPR